MKDAYLPHNQGAYLMWLHVVCHALVDPVHETVK